MTGSIRERLIFLLAILLGAMPFAFGVLRALTTGTDFRYLWVAIASSVGANGVLRLAKAGERTPRAVVALWAIALVIATLLAGMVAYYVGARNSAALWIVALSFALCSATSASLIALRRSRTV
jgi:FtsH-binding integral membrane protein